MRRPILIIAGVLINLTFFSRSWAQDIDLEKIVITPYRTEISSEANSSSVEKIDVKELEKEGVAFLKDALVASSSIAAVSSGGLGGDTSVFLRGHNSAHTRFMLDGIKIYDPMLTAAYYSFSHFNLQGLDKIEISKGPQSSLYGSDAIGGVINLFSRKGEGRPRFIFQQKAGSYNTYIESLDFLGRQEEFAYSLGVTRTDIGGYSLAKEKNNNHERDPYHNLNASLRLDYDLSDSTQLALLGRYIYAKYEYDGASWTPPYLPTDDDDNYAYDREGILGFIANQRISDILDYKLTLGMTRIARKGWEDAASDNWYDGRTYQVDNQFSLKLADFDKLIFGFDYLRELGDSFRVDSGFVSDFPKETSNNKGYFLENIFNPGNLLLALSYRIDDHSAFKDNDTYRAAAAYTFEATKTKLKASYGTGFKAPSLYQLYAPASSYGPIGNAALQPEESQSYEAGVEQEVFDDLKLSLGYFHSQLKNLIDYDYTAGYVNVGKSRIKGLESGLDYKANKNWSFGLGYTWLDTENKDNGAELARRPANKVTLKIKSEFDRLSAAFGLSYVGHRTSDTAGSQLLKSYILGNLSFNYRLRDNLDIFTRFENILDEKYEQIAGYQTPKFSAYAGFKVEF
ncbi:MAG: TonB-dependent receptor [Candidatus Omnitrophota bacterium]|jgi:vitamin B12 transporter